MLRIVSRPMFGRVPVVDCVRTFRSSPLSLDNFEPFSGPDGEKEAPRRSTDKRFPDWIEKYNRKVFHQIGYGLGAATALVTLVDPLMGGLCLVPTALFWYQGKKDMSQKNHSIRRNFPVLGNIRYLFESIRPEIRQYFVESDTDAHPFSRSDRSAVYQRAKAMNDTLPFGTRGNVYENDFEWVNHSIWPSRVPVENQRITVGGPHCKKPYSASLFNISAMSYGSLSENAVLALNTGAKIGNFYHNTGEGGISRFHKAPGGDIVWNVGTGYFGCRTEDGGFCPEMFEENANLENVKMIEIKLSQGAKPAHGGILPAKKINKKIAEARGLKGKGLVTDCVSPPTHNAFNGALGLIKFVEKLREISGGKPIGWKMCVGRPEEFAAICNAMVELDITPDFITVDGSEGGTGAAPPEFSDRVGVPLSEGLALVDSMLIGAGLRDRIKLISSGKIITGFHLVRQLALGADLCNSARGMMFALGCIQALKCNTNTCPTGITTQDPELMKGLDVGNKSQRVAQFHEKTVESALELISAVGLDHPDKLGPEHIMKRLGTLKTESYSMIYPVYEKGCLLTGNGPEDAQSLWSQGKDLLEKQKKVYGDKLLNFSHTTKE